MLNPKASVINLLIVGGYIEVGSSGGRYFRRKYRLNGNENCLALGVYPDVTLAEARAARDTAKKQIAEGLNPARKRKLKKLELAVEQNHSFKAVPKCEDTQQAVTEPLLRAQVAENAHVGAQAVADKAVLAQHHTRPFQPICLRTCTSCGKKSMKQRNSARLQNE